MGQQFNSAKQQSPVNHESLRWVPRSSDMFGGGSQGATLIVPVVGEDVLFTDLAIRDTVAVDSPVITNDNPTGTPYDQAYASFKTALFTSTLNQIVTVQPLFTRDYGVTWYPFGTTSTIAAYSGTGPAQTLALALSTPTLYIPFVGVQVSCGTGPTSGLLNGWLERLG